MRWISTEWLESNLEEVHLIDVQPEVHDYLAGHIPGAVHLSEGFLRSYDRGRLCAFMPPEVVQPYLRRGLRMGMPVVVYSGKGAVSGRGDGLGQDVMAYALARYGHDQVLVLDGGIDKWIAEERPLSNSIPEFKPSEFVPQVREELFLQQEGFEEMKDMEGVMLLDARPSEQYRGEGPILGHIPGAASLPYTDLMKESNLAELRSLDFILSMVKGMGITKDRTVICSSGTGRAATSIFLLFKWYLRYPDVRMYEASLAEWASRQDNLLLTGKDCR